MEKQTFYKWTERRKVTGAEKPARAEAGRYLVAGMAQGGRLSRAAGEGGSGQVEVWIGRRRGLCPTRLGGQLDFKQGRCRAVLVRSP